MSNSNRANALPFLGRGPVNEDPKDSGVAEKGFVAIAMIFARTWPFLKPYVVGYWRELSLSRRGAANTPETVASDTPGEFANDPDSARWSFNHIPPLQP